MPRNKPLNIPRALPGGEMPSEVYGYLASLGYQNIDIQGANTDRCTIEADLTGTHYIASTNTKPTLNAAERIMSGYWLALTSAAPFDMQPDGTASIQPSEENHDYSV